MPISQEAQEQIDALKTQVTSLTAQNEALQVNSHMAAREADVDGLLSRLKLPSEASVPVEFSEPGEAPKSADVTWKKFLVGLSAESYEAFKGLTQNVSAEDGGGLNFSEFDSGSGDSTGTDLSEGNGSTPSKAQLEAARKAYLTGQPMSA